ncbi:hypothetical protein FHW84_003057 [Dyella sp. SG562]|uniref:hypothetical protein n=1 Tax=Dyella sp. SG562 TaxID=2587017 RepID=UPI001421B971|nr:hypothetical protein [Dyella sp. SG562]NII74467.1 hypothetical protein [Dyella sp. SG562]
MSVGGAVPDDENGDVEKEYRAFVPMLIFICLSVFAIVTCAQRISDTFLFSADFTVESSYRVCQQPLNNRCVTHYRIKNLDGNMGDFVPFGDQFGEYMLDPDVHITKRQYSFSYEVDGIGRRWPYLWTHIFILLAGVFGVVIWFRLMADTAKVIGEEDGPN